MTLTLCPCLMLPENSILLVMHFNSVDLPIPLAPSNAIFSPRPTAIEIAFNIFFSPYDFERSSISNTCLPGLTLNGKLIFIEPSRLFSTSMISVFSNFFIRDCAKAALLLLALNFEMSLSVCLISFSCCFFSFSLMRFSSALFFVYKV